MAAASPDVAAAAGPPAAGVLLAVAAAAVGEPADAGGEGAAAAGCAAAGCAGAAGPPPRSSSKKKKKEVTVTLGITIGVYDSLPPSQLFTSLSPKTEDDKPNQGRYHKHDKTCKNTANSTIKFAPRHNNMETAS